MAIRFPRVNVHVLTVFLVVGLPLFAIGAFLAVGSGQAQLRQTYGQQLAQVAEHAAAGLDAYIYRRVIDAAVVARVPDVLAAAAAGNAIPFDRAAAARLTPGWMSGASSTKVTARAKDPASKDNRAARFFAEVAATDPLFREILATDAHGRVVATVAPRNSYYLADESWWQEARGDGRAGRTTVSDIQWDKRSRAYFMEIAAPIVDASAGVVGVLRVVFDAREMLAMIGDLQLGLSGNAFLLRDDGSVVYSRWPGAPGQPFFAADLLRERLRALGENSQPARLFLAARAQDGTGQMIGLARSQMGLTYSHLSWLVAVSQADSELFAPVTGTGWNLLLVLALTAVAVLGFTLWDSRRLAARPEPIETDLQLVQHPRMHWTEEPDREEIEETGKGTPAGA